MKPAILARLAVASAIIVSGVLVATPASAATLPSGDAFYTISCDASFDNDFQLYGVDAATGLSTPIGTGNGVDDGYCSYNMAWNSVNQTLYNIADGNPNYYLGIIDRVTGSITKVGDFLEGVNPVEPDAIAIGTDGAAYIVTSGELYSLDLGSGALVDLGAISGVTDYTYGFAVDPTSGEFYLIQSSGNVLQLDIATRAATLVGTFPVGGAIIYSYGLTIDSAGQFWIITYEGGGKSGVWSADKTDIPSAVFSGYYHLADDTQFYSFIGAITPVPVIPALAATGVDASPLIAGAVGIMLLGGVLLMTRRRAA